MVETCNINYKMLSLRYRSGEVPVSKIYPYSKKERYTHINPVKDFLSIVKPIILLGSGVRK